MTDDPVIRNFAYCLAHVPDLVRYGSKPRREIIKDPTQEKQLGDALRTFPEAVCYPPNQTFVGNMTPAALGDIPRPWFGDAADTSMPAAGRFGDIVSQDLFYGLLKRADVLEPPLVELLDEQVAASNGELAQHPVYGDLGARGIEAAGAAAIGEELAAGTAIPLYARNTLVGCVKRDDRTEGREDDNLDARYLLEALCVKASGALALQALLEREGIGAGQVDYLISCGEEACGDRYQRGGGGMAKSIGEMCACLNASGMDIKNFCAAPGSALVTAGALIRAGLYRRVIVVAGGSLAKLGMKYQAFLRAGTPVLEDCLASMAFLVTADDGCSPRLRLGAGTVGLAGIGSSTSDQAVYRQLILKPLAELGLGMGDIDKYAPELHNPEIMENAGSGDVVYKNYRTISAMAVLAGVIDKAEMPAFMERVGMPGFAPTQGHVPSAVPYIGHAADAMARGELARAMFLCKASLFLNRITQLYDGVSFVLEANGARTP